MSTTTATFLAVTKNLARYQTMTANEPDVKTATAYYEANIGSVTSASGLVKNYRLLSYALQAYGLGNQINSTALVQKVLEGGVSNPKSLANTLPNPAWKAFAAAFDYTDSGAAAIASRSPSAVKTTTGDYVEQQLESNEGQQDPGVQLALYFQRVAPTVTTSYGILGNENLLEVVQTIFGLGSTTTSSQIDAEATAVGKLVPLAELQDPTKVTQLAERFGAAYDAKYGSGSSSSLTVVDGSQPTTVSAASSILAGVVSSTATALSSLQTNTYFSTSLLDSLQGVRLGG